MKHYPFLNLATINHRYNDAIKEAVNRVVDSGIYIGGPEVETFEKNMCNICNTPHCVGVSTGLDALRLILRGYMELGALKPNDEIIVPANTFIASVLAITDNNLKPIFVDPNQFSHNIDSHSLESYITQKTKAIMPVHLYGRVAWDEYLASFVKKYGLKVIEDNAQALGATSLHPGLYGSYATGSLGDAAAISFYPTKNVGAMGDAGAIVTNDSDLAQVVASLRNYGSDKQYHNTYRGLNCRLDPIQAAIINTKLPYLKEENEYRQQIADIYDQHIDNAEIVKPIKRIENEVVWHQYVIRVSNRTHFRDYMLSNGVETGIHYPIPPHKQPCYEQYSHLNLPIAEQLANEVVSLPISRCTSINDACEIAAIINNYRR